jgi:lipoprotein NlpI
MYMILTAHFGYRQEHRDAEADDMLKKAAAVVDHTLWPYPVIRYLQHEITAEQLLAQATDSDKQTEAHTYLGLDHALKGKREEALQHLRWVKDHGNKHFYEYPVAIAELERLEKGAGT